MIPFLIGRSFDILRAVAAGDVAAIARMSTPELAARAAAAIREEPYHSAAVRWVAGPDRSVKGRTGGKRSLARFHVEGGRALVLELEDGLLVRFATMSDSEFESFGLVV